MGLPRTLCRAGDGYTTYTQSNISIIIYPGLLLVLNRGDSALTSTRIHEPFFGHGPLLQRLQLRCL